MGKPPSRIAVGDFKAECRRLVDEVSATGGRVVITKRGVPVAVLGPACGRARPLLGSLRHRIEILGEIVAPVAGVTWGEMR